MNYTSMIAIILGMISVVITLKYMKYYDDFNKNLKKLNKNCLNKEIPKSLIELQNDLDLTDREFSAFIAKNKKKIIGLLDKRSPESIPIKSPITITLPSRKTRPIDPLNRAKEPFVNYGYTDISQRGLKNVKFTKFIKSNKNNKCKMKTYDDELLASHKNSLLYNRFL